MPLTIIMTYFDCHTHFKILLESPHPKTNIFSFNLDELENLLKKWGDGNKYLRVPLWHRHNLKGFVFRYIVVVVLAYIGTRYGRHSI